MRRRRWRGGLSLAEQVIQARGVWKQERGNHEEWVPADAPGDHTGEGLYRSEAGNRAHRYLATASSLRVCSQGSRQRP